MACDFRFEKDACKGLRYAICGLGNSLYEENFNTVAKKLDKCFVDMRATPVCKLYCCDENTANSKHSNLEGDVAYWKNSFFEKLDYMLDESASKGECCQTNTENACACKSNDADVSGDDESEPKYETTSEEEDDDENYLSDMDADLDDENNNDEAAKSKKAQKITKSKNGLIDMEDIGTVFNKIKNTKAKPKALEENGSQKEMITPLLRKSLEKQGYKLIGTHSGVKLCRWTKSMLRGRGGCYKHTFYGIESHRCLETTPSLACANKCVFCWRHHTLVLTTVILYFTTLTLFNLCLRNPVGTEWKWKMDPAELIFETALKNHYSMINEFKGVPGVKPERLQEGFDVKHCALSLVGEPIMYPQINEFIDLLHSKRISSFLVTNAQFPDAIKALKPVTQLYVSVDAPTKESLKRIDRPLFKDFWQRYIDSLKALGAKKQRTVYRLTLVKGWNTEHVEQYAQLIDLGKPDFIEIKGVTYCGESNASDLTMQNVPWYQEVMEFVKVLQTFLPNVYELSCEHQHSNCLLISHTKFKINSEWWTFIDYEKFHDLVREYELNGTEFTSLDYIAKTPLWALHGAKEAGFDPRDLRHLRKSKKDISGC
jgi:tRNA wybutosine-synthesizing protein 1